MKNKWVPLLAWLATGLLTNGAAAAQGLVALETDDQRLIYIDPLQAFLAPHAARCYQNALQRHRQILGFDPDQRATIFLRDFSDYGNASASGVPRNILMFDIAPMSFTFETFSTSERMCNLMNHELVHVVATDQATSADNTARRLFGGKVSPTAEHPESILYSYLTNPRVYAPRWYHEGIAVFLETWMGGGYGRAQGAYDEMVFRSMVRDDAYFYDPLGLESEGTSIDFQVGVNHYLYGTRFVSYLAYTYSPDKLVEWIRRTEGSESHYTAHFAEVFGAPLDAVWQDWIDFEHAFQEKNLSRVRQYPVTPHEDIAARGLGSVSRMFHDPTRNKLIWALRYPGEVAHVGDLDLETGRMRNLVDVKGPMLYSVTSLAWDPATGTAFYTADNYAWRDLMALDIETGKTRMLQKDIRVGELVFNEADRSLWGVRHVNGIATIVRMPHPYDSWKQVHTLPYGQVLYDLDISPDGTLLSASFGEADGQQSLRVFSIEALLDGDATPLRQFDFGQAVPESFVFSPDGKYLYGSSYYTGISNIFRFEVETGDLEAVSNAESGFFRPLPLEDGRLIVLRYTGQGFLPTRIEPKPLDDVSNIAFLGTEIIRKYPELETWQVGSPADVPLDDLKTREDEYRPFGEMGLQSIYPVLEGYKDEVAAGITMNFSDPIELDSIDFTISHSIASDLPSSEDLHAELEWRHVTTSQSPLAGVWTATLRHNAADFYDLFGPTKTSRKGQSGTLAYEKTLIYDKPRQLDFSIEASHYVNLDALPRYQNVEVDIDTLSTLEAVMSYSHIRRSLGAVDDEKGFKWRLAAAGNHVDGDSIPKFFGEFDFGFALPWGHSSVWLRNASGVALGEVDDPFANFFFGGFGNNYVDAGEAKRYREWYSMPGFELNEIGGRNFYRGMLELNLPPVRFRNAGGSRFYLSWARPAVFVSSLITNADSNARQRNVSSAGTQVDFQFTILSQLSMMLSLGYAVGFGEGVDGSSDEFMISLKVL